MGKKRVAINGFGRIGRSLLRVLLERDDAEVVAVNDLADLHTLAHLFRYDSVHGKFKHQVHTEGNNLITGSAKIAFSQFALADDLPWADQRVDVVIDCTGVHRTFSSLSGHLRAGASQVILSAPPDTDDIPMVIIGVNHQTVDLTFPVISCASCTTNSAAPLIQLIDEYWGIESCYITTVHSYTGDQRLHDAPHRDLRRARAAALSIVPTSTGAAKALTHIFPHLSEALGGCGIRVPVPDGSLTDITCIVRKPAGAGELNQRFQQASKDRYLGILEYTDHPIVSVDVIGNPHSCLFDAQLTSVIGNMVKVVGWYDNEMGYSNRLADLIALLSSDSG
jgi:glyceraldehyde 3-phosphate dehydrogenase